MNLLSDGLIIYHFNFCFNNIVPATYNMVEIGRGNLY